MYKQLLVEILNANLYTFDQLNTEFLMSIALFYTKGNLVHGSEKTFFFNYYTITKVLILP